MKRELTDRYLKSLVPPEAGRIEVSDTKRPGLRFRLSNSGRAVWMFEKRIKGGPKRKHTLGSWPEPVSLSEARAMALELEAEAAKGIDRIAEAEEKRLLSEAARAEILTVQEAIETYFDLHLASLRTGQERRRQIETALHEHAGRKVTELNRAILQQAVDAKARAGRLVYANRIRAALKAFSKWCWNRGYIPEDVGSGIGSAAREKPRERVLSLTEIRAIWAATFDMGALWGPFFRLLLLTAQRRGEILALKLSEISIEKAQIVKPGSTTKNGKTHTTHLSAPALEEISAICDRLSDCTPSTLLFTTTGVTPVSGISRAKARLDRLLGADFEPWRIHDIRTAFATSMAEAGVSEAVADRVLNHSASGSAPSAVARVYNQSELLPQRARALDKWAALVIGESSNVVRLEASQ